MNFKELYSLEGNNKVVDKLGRIRTYSKNYDLFSPLISKEIYNLGFRPRYKDKKKFAVVLSHDVDYVFNQISLGTLVKRNLRDLSKARLKNILKDWSNVVIRKPFKDWSVDKLIDIEKELNIPATYFFLCLEKGEDDFNYKISELKSYIDKIVKNGSEIAFHGGLKAFEDENYFNKEYSRFYSRIGSIPKGYRSHFLKFNSDKTFHLLQKRNFLYDATLGLPDSIGFRNGMCYPYRPIYWNSDEFENILEIPLHIMDVSFFKYMNLNLDQSIEAYQKVVNEVKNVEGVISILWHNNNMSGDYKLLYDYILKDLTSNNDVWFCTHEEFAEHWINENLEEMEKYLLKLFAND
jgi:peptidoglycan/xylan/chitin deacetylase (PgdA/CDA1 family)